jgi:hypothetical protein
VLCHGSKVQAKSSVKDSKVGAGFVVAGASDVKNENLCRERDE